MVSVKIILDKRSTKKDGTHPLKLRVILHRKTHHLPLGYSVPAKDWDSKGQRIKTSCKAFGNITRINAILHKEQQKAMDILLQLQIEERLEIVSFTEIKRLIQSGNHELKVLAFAEEVIAQLRDAGKHGNARVYETMRRSIRDFQHAQDIPMRQLSYRWLKQYESWYLGKGNSVNGLSVLMRTLRALFNRAIKQKRVEKKYYPFEDYRIKQEGTRKRAISEEDLQKIKDFTPQTPRQRRAKDYFLLSFYLMGTSFVDLAFLQKKNIIRDRIEYKRRKTGRLHSIPIFAPVREILERYGKDKKADAFLLDVIHAEDPKQQLVNVRDELRRYNKTLKAIAKECGIEASLTSYAARHSYATIAKYKGVPTAVISEALGHKSPEVTQVYLDSFDKQVLDDYHKRVIE
ncbi:MAG: site-specific integrase [Chitinophagales bacterium]|nr:site-specific integrase [Chitinophagales bacterium]